MARYRIHQPVETDPDGNETPAGDSVHVQTSHHMLGSIEASFPVGDVEPASEEEQILLDSLVASGHAELVEADAEHDPVEPRWETTDGADKPRRKRARRAE